MSYTIDDECCKNIDEYISDQENVVKVLAECLATWTAEGDSRSFVEILKSKGLGIESDAGGGVSSSVKKKAKCYQEVIEEIESTHTINVVQALQLALIGGVGYWNPFSPDFWDENAARTQWMLTRFAIELIRAKWKLVKLKKIKELCGRH